MVELSATEVARNFSDVLNRVARGETVVILRNGLPVAELTHVGPARSLSPAGWRAFIENAPPVDEDFARDLELIRDELNSEQPRDPWES